jgi:hypothetical protein
VQKKYLLPCRCGQEHVVEPRHAGGEISCSCGTVLAIPRLIEMENLEPAPEESSPPTVVQWGGKQRMAFLGIVIVLAMIGAGVWLYHRSPVPPIDMIDPEAIQQKAQGLTPLQTWSYWEGMKQHGLGRTDAQYVAALLSFRIWLGATIALALFGIVLIVVGFWPPKTGGSPPR